MQRVLGNGQNATHCTPNHSHMIGTSAGRRPCCSEEVDVLPVQMSLKKGGADENVPKALRYLLATAQEVKEVEEQIQTTSQWLADILEYRRLPTPMTPFDYITLSDATELKVQEASS